MPKFKHPCFVRVEDAAEKKGLIEWLMAIGYSELSDLDKKLLNRNEFFQVSINSKGKILITTDLSSIHEVMERINCGTNIDLFKAIAAINDDNDYMQWFVNDAYANIRYIIWHLSKKKKFNLFMMDWADLREQFHKATVAELIEKFNK